MEGREEATAYDAEWYYTARVTTDLLASPFVN
jgi:hypothetical protein